jgi:MFS family permease
MQERVLPFVNATATKLGLSGPQWASYAGMSYNAGAILGYISLGFLADALGRKPTTFLFFGGALLLTPVLFLWTHGINLLLIAAFVNGFFSLGQYAWMAVWLPELFPTPIRGAAVAFCFNSPRLIASVGPLIAGTLIVHFGGFGNSAMIVDCIYILGMIAMLFLPGPRALGEDARAPRGDLQAEDAVGMVRDSGRNGCLLRARSQLHGGFHASAQPGEGQLRRDRRHRSARPRTALQPDALQRQGTAAGIRRADRAGSRSMGLFARADRCAES